jgi:SAM-dependent methyltransferase
LSEAPHLRQQWAESFGSDPDRRRWGESFGEDAERYDRARPRYPDELVRRIVAGSPGREFLDVGCGTGIASRQFAAAGCNVLGVDVDARMADRPRNPLPASTAAPPLPSSLTSTRSPPARRSTVTEP